MSLQARIFITSVIIAGAMILGHAALSFHSSNPLRFFCYLAIASLASSLKVKLPGIHGTLSVNFVFILLCVIELTLPEAVVIGFIGALVQSVWKTRTRTNGVKLAFNLAALAIPTMASFMVYHCSLNQALHCSKLLLLAAAACTYFLSNSVPIATVIALTEQKRILKVWRECYFWALPYYLVGGGIAGLVGFINCQLGWELSLLVAPAVYLIYRSYSLYLGRLEDEKRHVEEVAALHLRTIEALALAIEAKDQVTHDHLRRVQVYAVEIAKELGLTYEEQEALRAAALLHDIGKLAVPEHILSKPGRLTAEEFDKMKIHPVVGAEILERVQFPYPVVPIVRSHHEKWNGCGYPYGLKREEIPMPARILAAVDCLDALASDRQYRRALPLDKAMRQVAAESGTSFDPRVVEILQRRYIELESIAKSQCAQASSSCQAVLSLGKEVPPARGFEPATAHEVPAGNFLSLIAAARQEAQTLFELSHDLGNSLSLDETLSVLSLRLKRLVPYDAIAIYIRKENRLVPAHVSGDDFRLFSSLEIPLGQGLSGWVAENRTPMINGDPSVETGYLNDTTKLSTLRSALSVPLDGLSGVIGVLTLYKAEADAFSKDHLRVLLAISSKVGLSMENALKYEQAENSSATDYLTGLPNARSLFVHLDGEVARCKRTNTSLAVMVCDMNGFKQVNDRFGHLEGNKVLRTFSQKLLAICREYDYVARMGGDEFVVIAPGLQREAAAEKARRMTILAAEAGREACGSNLLSLSVGTAFYAEDGFDAEQLLAEADRNMYAAKQRQERPLAVLPIPPAVPGPVLAAAVGRGVTFVTLSPSPISAVVAQAP
jgi:diguanylate cyclase (GGDEF)-like protein/putative nucleotidyltransferase with HDIG domain